MSEQHRVWKISWYEDLEGLDPLTEIDIGEVWIGEFGRITIFMKNDEIHNVRDIVFDSTNNEVKIQGPRVMTSRQIAPVELIWHPGIDAEKGLLETLVVTGVLVLA